MTTNVLDKRNKKVTSDSRWSITVNQNGTDLLLFVDDTGFDKIAERPMAVMVCAGDAKLIEQWKNWFTNPAPANAIPPTDRTELDGSFHEIYVTIIEKPSYQVLFSSGVYEHHEDAASFTGSGGSFAKECYCKNGCCFRCIETASQKDPRTGGRTKFVDFTSSTSNLHTGHVTVQDVADQLVNKGSVMNMTTKTVSPIASTDKTELAKALAADRVSIAAPTGQPPRTWTVQEKLDVSTAMRKIVELEKAANSEP